MHIKNVTRDFISVPFFVTEFDISKVDDQSNLQEMGEFSLGLPFVTLVCYVH